METQEELRNHIYDVLERYGLDPHAYDLFNKGIYTDDAGDLYDKEHIFWRAWWWPNQYTLELVMTLLTVLENIPHYIPSPLHKMLPNGDELK
tara:strand:- start:5507 stop:5782 length:276 start_codon:yes stop_codon:yes gene_type:complete